MFFYASLFIASLFAALVVLWVFRTIKYNAGSVYKTVIPGTANRPTRRLKSRATPITDNESPWGWKSHETPANSAKTHAALPTEKPHWDWSGSQNEINDRDARSGLYDNLSKRANARKAGAGRLHREEKLEFAGKAYKVTRKVSRGTPESDVTTKPWGW